MPYLPDLIAHSLGLDDAFWVIAVSFSIVKLAGIAALAWLLHELFVRDQSAGR